MKDLTIIVPIKEYDPSMDELINRAIDSCGNNFVIIIGKNVDKYEFTPKEDDNIVPSLKKIENNSDNLTYQHNVNIAVDMVETKYFSVLEYDDRFSDIWFKNVENYINNGENDISIYLPLTEIVDYEKNTVIGYSNDAFWASSFCEDIGYLDSQAVESYFNFNMSGAIIKTNDFIVNGKLKESMKAVFWLEFILRSLHENKKLYVIPKVGYYHYVGRPDSLTNYYIDNMSEKEVDWWIDLAKKEYFFKKDRNKVYEE